MLPFVKRPQFSLRLLLLSIALLCALLAAVVEFRAIDHAQLTYSAQFGWDFYLAWKGQPPPDKRGSP